MFGWLKDFFINKQTFASTMGDVMGGIAVGSAIVVSNPEILQPLIATAPWALIPLTLLGYIGGAVSGRKTKE